MLEEREENQDLRGLGTAREQREGKAGQVRGLVGVMKGVVWGGR